MPDMSARRSRNAECVARNVREVPVAMRRKSSKQLPDLYPARNIRQKVRWKPYNTSNWPRVMAVRRKPFALWEWYPPAQAPSANDSAESPLGLATSSSRKRRRRPYRVNGADAP